MTRERLTGTARLRKRCNISSKAWATPASIGKPKLAEFPLIVCAPRRSPEQLVFSVGFHRRGLFHCESSSDSPRGLQDLVAVDSILGCLKRFTQSGRRRLKINCGACPPRLAPRNACRRPKFACPPEFRDRDGSRLESLRTSAAEYFREQIALRHPKA